MKVSDVDQENLYLVETTSFAERRLHLYQCKAVKNKQLRPVPTDSRFDDEEICRECSGEASRADPGPADQSMHRALAEADPDEYP